MAVTTSVASRVFATTVFVPVILSSVLFAQNQEPFRLNRWMKSPDSLRVFGEERIRFESLDGQFRGTQLAGTRDIEDQVFSRLLLQADYTRGDFGFTVQGIDARAWGTKANSFANTTTVNTFDVLQANVSYRLGEGNSITVGRYVMDIGSRRLSARNKYRNTINSFNGARWDYNKGDYSAGAFWAMPTNRRPAARALLVDNEHDWDSQTLDFQFYGLHSTQKFDDRSTAQVYVLQLSDHRNGVTSRDLTTAGFRFLTPAERGKMFGEAELAYQFGSRGAAAVHAYFAHGSIGKVFDHETKPTLRLALDIASGNDANDPDWNRFDTLFGARRFEYGPTGIYGAIGRRNIVSPEIRFSIKPTKNTWVLVAARDFRLASTSDGWREAGDATGTSSDIGQQAECRLRWDVVPKSVRLEGGAAYLAGGEHRATSTTGRRSDTNYFFFEAIFTF